MEMSTALECAPFASIIFAFCHLQKREYDVNYALQATRNKFDDCACTHLSKDSYTCPFVAQPAAEEDRLVPAARFRSLQLDQRHEALDERLAMARRCICLHNPHCPLFRHIPEFILPDAPAGWIVDLKGGKMTSPDGKTTLFVEPVKNPEFTRHMYGTRERAETKSKRKTA